jgi:hypothetical protein
MHKAKNYKTYYQRDKSGLIGKHPINENCDQRHDEELDDDLSNPHGCPRRNLTGAVIYCFFIRCTIPL